jgi:hypothetical protein
MHGHLLGLVVTQHQIFIVPGLAHRQVHGHVDHDDLGVLRDQRALPAIQ